MNRLMDFDEAYTRAQEELAPRREQMTALEYDELMQDHIRALLGERPLARLEGGRRLTHEEMMQVLRTTDAFLHDMHERFQLGDARLYGDRRLALLFRLSDRLDIGHSVEVKLLAGVMNLTEAVQHAAVRAFDELTPEKINKLKDARP